MNEKIKKPEVIFFDLDDTILAFSKASSEAWKLCCQEFVKRNNVYFSSEQLYNEICKAREWYWSDEERNKKGRADMINARREVFSHALHIFNYDNYEEVVKTADNYIVLQEKGWSLFEGLPQAFYNLKSHGIKLVIVTNGKADYQRKKLAFLEITELFDDIIIDTEIGFSKPDIKIYELALKRMRITSSQGWFIGDNLKYDVLGPKQVGIFSVWNNFNNRKPSEVIIPDLTVSSISEMVKFLFPDS